MIRHGEKPVKDDSGVDQHGNVDGDGLIPKGWARAGALASLSDANDTTLRSTLPSPDALVSPLYSKPIHRTCLTLLPLAKRLDRRDCHAGNRDESARPSLELARRPVRRHLAVRPRGWRVDLQHGRPAAVETATSSTLDLDRDGVGCEDS
jgi:hypothetical protein